MATKKSYDLKKDLVTTDDNTFIQESKSNLIDNFCRIKHGCNLGDIIASLAAVKRFYDVTKRKVIFCQVIDLKAAYYPGATHPTQNSVGEMVCLNTPMFEMMKPLIDSQEYIQ